MKGVALTDREDCEADFRDIYEMADRRAVDTLLRLLKSANSTEDERRAIRKLLEKGKTAYLDMMFAVHLDLPQIWSRATIFFASDKIGSPKWVKHPQVPKITPKSARADLKRLGKKVVTFLHTIEGRGPRYEVSVDERDGAMHYLCWLEGFPEIELQWKGDVTRRATQTKAELLQFVYSQAEGTLDTYMHARRHLVPDLQSIFSQEILGLKKLDPPPNDRRVYDLERFKERSKWYQMDPDSGVEFVGVRHLRLTPKLGPKRHIILDATPIGDKEPIYDLLQTELGNLKLDELDVTQVGLKVFFPKTKLRRQRTISPVLSHPNRCSLRYDGFDLEVRKMLIKSGIEPRDPEASVNS